MTCPQFADPRGPFNQPQPISTSLRLAISAGPLTAVRLATREAEARQQGTHLLDVCSEAELLHLQFIQRALPLGSGWEQAIDAIRAAGG